MMRVLVTGSSGHVGGAVVRHLCAEGHEVVGLSRRVQESFPSSVQQLSLDITDRELEDRLQEEVGLCDAVVHCAAYLGADVEASTQVNCFGTRQILDATFLLTTKHFVHISGLNFLRHPLRLPVTEEHVLAMPNTYAATKYLSEWMALDAGQRMAVTSLRPSSPVGPGLQYRRIFRIFVEKALKGEEIVLHGEGGRRQDYVDVRDIALAVSAVLKQERRRTAEVFNIAAGVSVSNLELAESCVRVLGSSSAVRFSGERDPDEAMVWEISIRKAEAILGYTPRYSLDDSIRDLARELPKE